MKIVVRETNYCTELLADDRHLLEMNDNEQEEILRKVIEKYGASSIIWNMTKNIGCCKITNGGGTCLDVATYTLEL